MGLVNNVLAKIFGNKSKKDVEAIMPMVDAINEEHAKLKGLSNEELRAKTSTLRGRINDYVAEDREEIRQLREPIERGELDIGEREEVYAEIDKIEERIDEKLEEVLEEVLPEAFAIVKDTARRFFENEQLTVKAEEHDRRLAVNKGHIEIKGDHAVWQNRWEAGGTEIIWDMIHYDVQLIGGVVLHQGKIAEMATGEGKTLAATLPVFLNALTGRGVHLVTVNDYLARRDAEWMGPIYEFHGLTVDCIDKYQPHSKERKEAYRCDVTFGTNNEFGFDYLRDNMSASPEDLVQRRHNYTIVDEVDSVLIDDARTPLIISGPTPKGSDTRQFQELKPKVEKLASAQRQLVTRILAEAKKLIKEGDKEKGGLLLLRAHKGLPKNKALIKYLSEEGNRTLMQKTENHYMADNSKHMHKVTDELFFIIEEKMNSIELTEKGIELITSSTDDSTFYVLPDIGSEIAEIDKSGISDQEKVEKKDQLLRDYAVKSERVHTMNQLLKAYSLFEKDVEYVVMDNKVKIVDEQTGRIMDGRRYSDGLHQAIESKENVKVEAATQTHATITLQNYFRMYHKLAGMTGTAETEAGEFWDIYKLDVVVIPTNRPIVRDDRQDLVYKTVREKYNAVIEEIVDLVSLGRPVLVGTTSVEISELLSRMLKIRNIKHNVLNAKLHAKEADIVAQAGKAGGVTIATNMAGRGTDIKLSKEVKEAGGLAIVGTERHESRRVDRQLRGRAGRQGDPGSSQFYVSLEDNLMRLFSSERVSRIMDRLGFKEGEVIQHSMITRSIERAQRKVEENNFGIRKRLLEYDDVMNSQREVIYKRRRHALFGERLGADIAAMLYDVSESIVQEHYGVSEFEDFKMSLLRILSIDAPITPDEFLKVNPAEITERCYKIALNTYKRKNEAIAKQALPVITEVYEKQSKVYENMVVPISDGQRVFQVVANLKKSYETQGRELIETYQKNVILVSIDEAWRDHLREMDDLRDAVRNAQYEQKDPLLIYKFESFELFQTMINKINREISSALMKAHIPIQDASQVKEGQERKQQDYSKYETSRKGDMIAGPDDPPQQGQQKQKTQPIRKEKKVGRNEPCPCGSGKKYKHCCGANVTA